MQIGDIVYLKSGSPPMVLLSVKGTELATQWMAGNQLISGSFLEVCLTLDDPVPALEKARRDKIRELEPPVGP